MADTNTQRSTGKDAAANATHGDHDRVAMLSLKADGTPDQLNPEILLDEQSAQDATRRQYAEQAVSAVDVEQRTAAAGAAGDELAQDPYVEGLAKAHREAAAAGEKAADAAVKKLS